ncbi:S-adenosylmethionine:tRNA ribosyltransferase-isomerase [Chryseotalea sanaruensis]|uniref:S-adenosylmethionine:tRNA ribosyltransferase-isomerase n=1 Tax=Chryseotalea sanaruensis TaxID=2482724 RepID=A0A401U4Q5_9BACT|nr:S-adenosylmethionine:tRNA ribosyltransferase-isomerase [Chryseotalea sanaruensis]GCC49881.1 S-adenosylmethionine:tRNA ribosyltransferase-isomerase [Chryseotalea sanaruensis]
MINIEAYSYSLPEERIAKYPLPERDQSKLLIYKDGVIRHDRFTSIVKEIPTGALMVFNNTKVIPARLHFIKDTGASIELFLLNPTQPSALLIEAMQSKKTCQWHCTIGNLKRWNQDVILKKVIGLHSLNAKLLNRESHVVEFSWDGDLSFAEIISLSGETPLPPYLKRSPEAEDKQRYQTVYSAHEGAVAAPTAGLHFTDGTIKQLQNKGVNQLYVTLHVSAGTFQPVKTLNALEHSMHQEQIVVNIESLRSLINHEGPIIPVGTTSMRTLESLYWIGLKLLNKLADPFFIDQHFAYQQHTLVPDAKEAIEAIVNYLNAEEIDLLMASTAIYIHPGYQFKICNALVTNFHQPGSTLMLLVAAFVGDDWKSIYNEALSNDYRFLSYGDSSILWNK